MVVALDLGSTHNEKMINIQNSNFILNPFQTFLSGLNFTKCSQAPYRNGRCSQAASEGAFCLLLSCSFRALFWL